MASSSPPPPPLPPPMHLLRTPQPAQISRNAVIWLALVGTACLITLSIALWLLLRFTCTRAARAEGCEVADGRNNHREWSRHTAGDVDASSSSPSVLEMANLTSSAAPHAGSVRPAAAAAAAAAADAGNVPKSWPLPSVVGRQRAQGSRYYASARR
ncbi:hypothetical protein MBLNU459_g5433t1 [Dothideomycetes sp. NU459]